MAEQTYVTPELKGMIGKVLGTSVGEVEKGAIKKFAQAIDDSNPLWQDEGRARESRYHGMIAPPTFVASLDPGSSAKSILDNFPLQRRLNAGNEIEYFHPIRPGDTMTMTTTLADVYERAGKDGKMVFFIVEVTYRNQRGEVAARARNTTIAR